MTEWLDISTTYEVIMLSLGCPSDTLQTYYSIIDYIPYVNRKCLNNKPLLHNLLPFLWAETLHAEES